MNATVNAGLLRAVVDNAECMLTLARIVGQHFVNRSINVLGAQQFADLEAGWKAKPRSLGPRRREANGDGVSVSDAAYWLELCAILARPADDFDHDTRRGWTIACRLTGLSWADVQSALTDTRHSGAHAAANAWAPHMKCPDARCIGRLYSAHAIGRPDPIKVGFSTNVEKRMKALSRLEGCEVVSVCHLPATMLHEWGMHMQLLHPVKSEWYPRKQIPAWLLSHPTLSTEAA